MTQTINNRFATVLSDLIDGDDKSAIDGLHMINNSYSKAILDEMFNGNLTNAMALLHKSCRFEANMNSKTGKTIEIDNIQGRIDNLILGGMDEKEATELVNRRAKRLSNPYFSTYSSIQSGSFII